MVPEESKSKAGLLPVLALAVGLLLMGLGVLGHGVSRRHWATWPHVSATVIALKEQVSQHYDEKEHTSTTSTTYWPVYRYVRADGVQQVLESHESSHLRVGDVAELAVNPESPTDFVTGTSYLLLLVLGGIGLPFVVAGGVLLFVRGR